jgi:hypothetical protein
MKKLKAPVGAALALLVPAAVSAQHLWWHKPGTYTAMYGEITVLATGNTMYYCGCNWWPSAPAGGYTGIQDQDGVRHNMIFSIWDTSEKLHPRVVEAEGRTVFTRFGGEGTGAHTHMDYHWALGKTYRFYVTKEQDRIKENTLTRLYFYDDEHHGWVHEGTISNPNNGSVSVPTFGGSLCGFLENWSGRDKEKPKLALYRLWLGTGPSDLRPVTESGGDGKWGTLDGCFYLAEGSDDLLKPVFERAEIGGTPALAGGKGPLSIPATPVPADVVRGLGRLPRAPKVGG